MMRDAAAEAVRSAGIVLERGREAGSLLDLIGKARIVLLGEATHGTQEFYRVRADVTHELIKRRGFNIVAVEGDWPDCQRANRWVRGRGPDVSAEQALRDFTRFPRWMWRNREVVRLLERLRGHNAGLSVHRQAGFYGLDLYSMHRSIDAVLTYLRTVDPPAAERARERYACFDVFGQDPQAYGYATLLELATPCRDEVIAQLVELRRSASSYTSRDGYLAADDYFAAEQNARVVKDAEAYYRAMFGSAAGSWNLRDRHMMSTLAALLDHLTGLTGDASAVVWAHNSHVGDARATRMGAEGELNLGQLAREAFGDQVCTVGFTTHAGTVTAASNWDEPAELMTVSPSLPGSYERLFHDTGLDCFAVDLRQAIGSTLAPRRLERAIGVVYRKDSERQSHYLDACLPRQFDIVVHYDQTRAVEPLERWSRHAVDLPETFPTGV